MLSRTHTGLVLRSTPLNPTLTFLSIRSTLNVQPSTRQQSTGSSFDLVDSQSCSLNHRSMSRGADGSELRKDGFPFPYHKTLIVGKDRIPYSTYQSNNPFSSFSPIHEPNKHLRPTHPASNPISPGFLSLSLSPSLSRPFFHTHTHTHSLTPTHPHQLALGTLLFFSFLPSSL